MNEVTSRSAQTLVEALRSGKSRFAFAGVKAEFEAEGSRIDDLKMLLFSGKQAGLETIVKIGGCESLRDMRDLAVLGRVENVVAPMIESVFALKKFIAMSRRVSAEYGFEPSLYFNLETISAWQDFPEILELAFKSEIIAGVTFGRGDFAESMGLARDQVDSAQVSEVLLTACSMVSKAGMKFGVGGTITSNSIPVLRQLQHLGAHAFETRKISWLFSNIPADDEGLVEIIDAGLRFELTWLDEKKKRYMKVADEDEARRLSLEERFGRRL
jgi:hypothetical protein